MNTISLLSISGQFNRITYTDVLPNQPAKNTPVVQVWFRQYTELLVFALACSLLSMPATVLAQSATLVNLTNTSAWNPSSPDPSGITYVDTHNALIISDSEVNETPLFVGDNLFRVSLGGFLQQTGTTIGFSDEPTGMSYNPYNNHLFISMDGSPRRVFELDPGADGLYDTVDDVVTSFSTTAFGSYDAEGLAYNFSTGNLHIADGISNTIYTVDPGNNGLFDGVAPEGDDLVSHFDTESLGILDPEGIAYDSDHGHLYIIGSEKHILSHVSTSGNLIRTIDLSDASSSYKPAGLAYAPASNGPAQNNLYIVDRGVDNNSDPNENDGQLIEMSLPPLVPGGGGTIALEYSVNSSHDDAEEKSFSVPKLASSDLEMIEESGQDQLVGMRFNNVNIPPNATITHAHIQFQVDQVSTGPASLDIEGEDVDNASTFVRSTENISSRNRTIAQVNWNPSNWNSVSEAGPDQRTPPITSIIQEIVDRAGWSNGNSLVLIISGTGKRVAESYNGSASGAPKLHIEYETGS